MRDRVIKDFFAILNDKSYGICPAPTSDRLAIQMLRDYLLGEDWYIAISMNDEQANTIIVDTILDKYSKRYRIDARRANDEQAD